MSQTRIYLPLDAATLRGLLAERSLGPAPVRAFAVTGRVERSLPTGDEEEWEYAALSEAVDAATELQGTAVAKRVVAAADVDPDWVGADTSRPALAAVSVAQPVPLARVVSFHLDETAGDQGMEDLLWYDATEVDEVVRLLG